MQSQKQGSTWKYSGDEDDTELPDCVCNNKYRYACEFGFL